MARNALARLITPAVPPIQPAANLVASRVASPAIGLANTQPIYSNPYI